MVMMLALAALLAGCSDNSPEPAPTPTATPTCPAVDPAAIQAEPIGQGSAAQVAANVLASYTAWANAGTELAASPAWSGAALPATCAQDLAQLHRDAYANTLFVTRSDVAWEAYYDEQRDLNEQNIALALETGHSTNGEYELMTMKEHSSTDAGTFLKFDAAFIPPRGEGFPPVSAETIKAQEWYVALVPWDGSMIIDYIELKDSADN
jgi:hypothetical protein